MGRLWEVGSGKVNSPTQWALWDKKQLWFQKKKKNPLFLLAELIFIRQKIKPIHKNNNRNLYSILCSLPKSILQSPQSLIATLVGSKDTFISLFYRQGNWDSVMLSESVQGHSVKLQSCDCQPAPQHTELIKVLWKKKTKNKTPCTRLVRDEEKSHWLSKKLQREQICQLERQKQEA